MGIETTHEELRRYLCFDDADVQRLRVALPIVEPHFDAIVEEFYERMALHPNMVAVFKDAGQIERQKVALRGWLVRVFTGDRTAEYFAGTAKIGRVHVSVGLPQRFMVVSMNVVRTALERQIRSAHPGAEDETVFAMHRAVDLDLAIMVDSYFIAELARAQAAERRESSQRTERLASIGTLAAGLAHEIRNPLNGAQLHLTFLRRRIPDLVASAPDGSELSDAIDVVSSEIKRLSRLVTEFLDFAKPHPLDLHALDLREPCNRAASLVAQEAEQLGVDLRLDLPTLPLDAMADRDRLTQVLLNLLRNALEAVMSVQEPEDRRVVLRGRRVNGTRILEVEDTGPGIADPNAPLFDPFFTTKSQGSGLGLSVAHRIVTDHDGTLTFASTPGRTLFSIRLHAKESS